MKGSSFGGVLLLCSMVIIPSGCKGEAAAKDGKAKRLRKNGAASGFLQNKAGSLYRNESPVIDKKYRACPECVTATG